MQTLVLHHLIFFSFEKGDSLKGTAIKLPTTLTFVRLAYQLFDFCQCGVVADAPADVSDVCAWDFVISDLVKEIEDFLEL